MLAIQVAVECLRGKNLKLWEGKSEDCLAGVQITKQFIRICVCFWCFRANVPSDRLSVIQRSFC